MLEANGAPPIFNLVVGGRTGVGERLVADRRFPLISATGSGRMGREVGKVVADRSAARSSSSAATTASW